MKQSRFVLYVLFVLHLLASGYAIRVSKNLIVEFPSDSMGNLQSLSDEDRLLQE